MNSNSLISLIFHPHSDVSGCIQRWLFPLGLFELACKQKSLHCIQLCPLSLFGCIMAFHFLFPAVYLLCVLLCVGSWGCVWRVCVFQYVPNPSLKNLAPEVL